jgi:hypothetical protein
MSDPSEDPVGDRNEAYNAIIGILHEVNERILYEGNPLGRAAGTTDNV